MLIARRTLLAALTLVIIAGCSSDEDEPESPPVVQLGPPGETGTPLTEDEIAELEETSYTDTDVAFVQNMIPHHGQALVMTDLVADRTARDDLPRLAERMDVSQRDEIALMEMWLEERGEEVPDASAGHDHGDGELMPGMLTEDDLARLEAASGRAFDELWLQYMIRHHEGARVMVAELLSGEGGQEPAVFGLAQHIDADQSIEIARMKSLLAEIAASSPT